MSKEEKSGKIQEEEEKMARGVELLLPHDILLSAGVHIGTRVKTKDLEPYIFRVRQDGIFILDIKSFNEKVKIAAKFTSQFDPSKVVVVSARLYGRTPVKKFCEVTGAVPIVGRFLPGLFSNPEYAGSLEPSLVIITDPVADRQAITETSALGIPVVAFCNTDNTFSNVDLGIPSNNKGKRSLAVIFWLLAREILRNRGDLPPDGDLSVSIDDFETKLTEAGQPIE